MKRIKYLTPVAMVAIAAMLFVQGCGTTTSSTGTPTAAAQWTTVGTAGFTSGSASNNSLAFDATTPYLACIDNGLASVFKYTTSWTQVTGASGVGIVSGDRDIDIQFQVSPWVAFTDKNAGSALTIKKWTGTDWTTSITPGTGVVSYVYLAMKSDNSPIVVYQDAATGYTPHAISYDGTSWTEIGSNIATSSATSLAIAVSSNAGATPYVVYRGGGSDTQLRVRYYTGSTWDNVESSGLATANVAAGSSTSVALCPTTGKPWVVYQDSTDNTIHVYAASGSGWVNKGVASSGAAKYPTIAFASDGTPYIGFQDVANTDKATVVKLVGTTWTPLGSAGFTTGAVTYTHLAIDSNNVPYLAFQDGANSGKATVMKFQ